MSLLRACWVSLLVGPVLLQAGCGGDRAGRPSNVLLISVDTLRPDHLGSYGYPRPTSPTLDRLAAQGVLFEDASSPSPWTLPAHASLLTGRYPSRHGLNSHEKGLPANIPTIAEVLLEHGFRTAAIVNSHNLSERYGLSRGFTDFKYVKENVAQTEPSAVEEEALRWLSERKGEPFFLFLHFYDVHSDYRSLPRYEQEFVRPSSSKADGTTEQLLTHRLGQLALGPEDGEHLKDLYDAGIRQMDDGLARLLQALDQQGLRDRTIVIVTSDHGEEFLEHGGVLHGRTQFQELIRIPLIVSGPGIPAGRRIREMVSLLDVPSTMLALAGAPWPAGLDGVDLRPLWRLEDTQLPPRLLFAEADHNNEKLDIKRAVRHERFTLHHDLMTGEFSLFDLAADPGERQDVLSREDSMAALLREQLEQFMAVDVSGEPIRPLSPEDVEKLKSLGYLQ